jgi:hypothetical protein
LGRQVLETADTSQDASTSAVLGMCFGRNACTVLRHAQFHCGLGMCRRGGLLGRNGVLRGCRVTLGRGGGGRAQGNAIFAPRCSPYTCDYLRHKAADVELGNAGLHSLLSRCWHGGEDRITRGSSNYGYRIPPLGYLA